MDSDIGHIGQVFDVYYSVVKHGEKLDPLLLKRTSVLLSILTERLITQAEANVLKRNPDEAVDRDKYRNCAKMIFFLDYHFLKVVNSVQATRSAALIKTKDNVGNWDDVRTRFLKQFHSFLKHPIAKLFDKNITDNSFIDLFTDSCYRILSSTTGALNRDVEDLVFHVLGLCFKRHMHTASYQSQILNILSQNEHAVPSVVNGLLMLYADYDLKSIFASLVPEFLHILGVQSKNATLTKNFAHFLLELGRKAPGVILPCYDALQQTLMNVDPYYMRTAGLELSAFIIMDVNIAASDATKLEMLHEMLESVSDCNSYVRSKVLQLLLLVNEKTHYVTQLLIKVLALAETHLEDKSALVRKNALLLIVELIRSNKSEKKLSIPVLEAELRVETEKMDSIMAVLYGLNTELGEVDAYLSKEIGRILREAEDGGGDETELDELFKQGSGTEQDHVSGEQIKTLMMAAYADKEYAKLVHIVRHVFVQNGDKETVDKMTRAEQEILYKVKCLNMILSACTPPEMQTEIDTIQEKKAEVETTIKYVAIVADCVEKTKRMLFSVTNSDVLAAIEFFKVGYVFSMAIVETGLREMLTLYGKADANVTQIVTQAFVEVLFRNKPQASSEKYYLETCYNLFKLLNDITVGEILAMEMLVDELMRAEIDQELITMLFRVFARKVANVTDNESRMALELLRMCAKSRPAVMGDNEAVFQAVVATTHDARVYATSMEILQYICGQRGKFTYADDSELVTTVKRSFGALFFRRATVCFDAAAKRVFSFLYTVAEHPDKVAEEIVVELYGRMAQLSAKIAEKGAESGGQGFPSSQQANVALMDLPVWLTTRLVYLIGVISMHQVIFLDTAVFAKLKRTAEAKLRDRDEVENAGAADEFRSTQTGARHRGRKSKATTSTASEENTSSEHVSEKQKIIDQIGESVTSICDLELLYNSNAFLGKFVPLVLAICKRRDTEERHEQLRVAAVLTLTNLMCVSVQFCEQNFGLAMKILESIDDPKVKLNIIIAFSDWIFQFPNVSEPWTKFIYGMLKSENDAVRLTTVTVLTYLIRQEMVRVRAQISDLALCLVDRDERIKETTRLFFSELSEKPQTMESVMPEIISKLNDETQHLPQFQYEEIMGLLFSLITKEKGTLVMVEKLCSRLKESRTESVAQKCSYCLTLLTHSEKTVRRVIEHMKDFRGKFQIAEVHASFVQLVAKVSKTAHNPMKVVVEELSAKVDECLRINEDGEEVQPSQPASQAVGKGKGRGNGRSKKKPRRSYSDDSENEENSQPRRAGRTRVARNVSGSE